MKKIVAVMLSLAICCNLFLSASASNATSEPTLKDIETQVMSYLEGNHPDVLANTETYISFLVDQMLTNADSQLSSFANYSDIVIYMGEYLNQMQTIPATECTGQLFHLPDASANLTPTEKRAMIAAENEEVFSVERSHPQSRSVSVNYNATQAVSYARTWAESYNPIYDQYTKDCTNFISQCLVAGGIPMEYPDDYSLDSAANILETTDYWYSDAYTNILGLSRWKVTTSFIRVVDLYSYLLSHTTSIMRSESIDLVQNLAQPGDVVQLRFQDGSWGHSIIITGGTTGNRTYCAHTSPAKDQPVSTITSAIEFRILQFS